MKEVLRLGLGIHSWLSSNCLEGYMCILWEYTVTGCAGKSQRSCYWCWWIFIVPIRSCSYWPLNLFMLFMDVFMYILVVGWIAIIDQPEISPVWLLFIAYIRVCPKWRIPRNVVWFRAPNFETTQCTYVSICIYTYIYIYTHWCAQLHFYVQLITIWVCFGKQTRATRAIGWWGIPWNPVGA